MKKRRKESLQKSKIIISYYSFSKKFKITNDQVNEHFLRNEKKREKLIKEENSKYTFHPKTDNIYHFDQNFEERQIFYSEISEKNIKQYI